MRASFFSVSSKSPILRQLSENLWEQVLLTFPRNRPFCRKLVSSDKLVSTLWRTATRRAPFYRKTGEHLVTGPFAENWYQHWWALCTDREPQFSVNWWLHAQPASTFTASSLLQTCDAWGDMSEQNHAYGVLPSSQSGRAQCRHFWQPLSVSLPSFLLRISAQETLVKPGANCQAKQWSQIWNIDFPWSVVRIVPIDLYQSCPFELLDVVYRSTDFPLNIAPQARKFFGF